MGRSVELTIHGVKVKVARAKECEVLSCFSDAETDLYDELPAMLGEYGHAAYKKEPSQHALQVSKIELRKNARQIEGLIEAGAYGSESDIRNLGRWGKVAYRKGTDDVDLHPFYFLFHIPEGRDLGYLVLQRTGVEGVQSLLAEALHDSFSQRFDHHRLQITSLIQESVVDELNKGKASEVRFIRHELASDVAALIGPRTTVQQAGSMELVVRLNADGGLVSAIRQFISQSQEAGSVLELEETRFQYDDVKVKTKLRGKERTVNLAEPNKIRASFDVTEEVSKGPSGHPRFQSISQVARSLLADFQATMVGGGSGADKN